MAHRSAVLLLVLCLTPAWGCDDDEQPIGEQICGSVTQRCHWNPATHRYDKDCVYSPTPDAGRPPVDRDAGCAAFPDAGAG